MHSARPRHQRARSCQCRRLSPLSAPPQLPPADWVACLSIGQLVILQVLRIAAIPHHQALQQGGTVAGMGNKCVGWVGGRCELGPAGPPERLPGDACSTPLLQQRRLRPLHQGAPARGSAQVVQLGDHCCPRPATAGSSSPRRQGQGSQVNSKQLLKLLALLSTRKMFLRASSTVPRPCSRCTASSSISAMAVSRGLSPTCQAREGGQ